MFPLVGVSDTDKNFVLLIVVDVDQDPTVTLSFGSEKVIVPEVKLSAVNDRPVAEGVSLAEVAKS